MKVYAYCLRKGERELFYEESERLGGGFAFTFSDEALTLENVPLTRGYDAVCITVNCVIDAPMAQALRENGVRYVITRAAGADHLDLPAIHRCGLRTANVPVYSRWAVSEHTILLLFMVLRRMREQLHRTERGDFSLRGLQGRELSALTVGVVGTGKIGAVTLQALRGFSCRLMACARHPDPALAAWVPYRPLEELISTCDVLIFHCPLTAENHHMIDAQAIARMKDGAVLINTARGGLFDWEAVLRGLESGKLGGVGMDVYEAENRFLRRDLTGQPLGDPLFEALMRQENLIYTTHTAFYTDVSMRNMVGGALEDLRQYKTTGCCENDLCPPDAVT